MSQEVKQIAGEIREDYIKNPTRCPFCKGEEFLCESFEADANYVSQLVQCESCGAEWEDVYTMSDIIIIKGART